MRACWQVYQLSIGAACNLVWPGDRIIVQVLDDSTDPTIKVRSESKNLGNARSVFLYVGRPIAVLVYRSRNFKFREEFYFLFFYFCFADLGSLNQQSC